MSGIKRRDFLATAAGAATCLGVWSSSSRADDDGPAPPQVPLGKTGITMSRVGQGTGVHGGRRQSDQTRMGFEKLVSLFRHDYDRGVTFFDLADQYGSHVYFREALRSIPREKISILTKLQWRYDGDPETNSSQVKKVAARAAVERFRQELNTDYLDIVLVHCLVKPNWLDDFEPYMDVLSEAKEKKQIRAVGVSCHNLGAMKTAASCPWVDVVLARINPQGTKMDGTVSEVVEVLREMKKNGKAVIGMKIYGEGKLAGMKEKCISFAQNLGLLDAMTVGAMTTQQMDETIRLMNKFPAAKVG